jgi:sugar/nucleoside kinase (ribokinase family)
MNSSVGLARLGMKASFCGVLGDDQWGQRLMETLKKEGVDGTTATVAEHETTGFSIVLLLPNGERTILHHHGTNRHLDDVTFAQDVIPQCDAVYLNRLSDDACIIENDIVAMLEKHPAIHLTWNPGGCQIAATMNAEDKAALLKQTDLLLLNKEEAEIFTGKKDIKEQLSILFERGVKHVCITDGKNGSYAYDGMNMVHCPCINNVIIVDTTGAGDAFGTGMTWALLAGKDLKNALKAGTINAASVISAIGAESGLLTETQMIEKMQSVSLEISSF